MAQINDADSCSANRQITNPIRPNDGLVRRLESWPDVSGAAAAASLQAGIECGPETISFSCLWPVRLCHRTDRTARFYEG